MNHMWWNNKEISLMEMIDLIIAGYGIITLHC
jgi:hypothetical protein